MVKYVVDVEREVDFGMPITDPNIRERVRVLTHRVLGMGEAL